MNILVALLIFTVIVVIHELGHFLLAKKNGVGVPEFSVGMGPRLITVAKGKKDLFLNCSVHRNILRIMKTGRNVRNIHGNFCLLAAHVPW